jgi:hypothetical protein
LAFLADEEAKVQREALLGRGAASPSNDDSALQSKTILIVVVGAYGVWARVAKSAVEILCLNGAEGQFVIDLNIKSSTYRHSESGFRKAGAAAESIAVATERSAHSTKIELGKWPKRTAVSKGKPRPEQKGKFAASNLVAYRRVLRKEPEYFATAQISRDAEQASYVIGECASAACAVDVLPAPRGDRANKHETRRGFDFGELALLS